MNQQIIELLTLRQFVYDCLKTLEILNPNKLLWDAKQRHI